MKRTTLRDPLCERAREYASLRLDGELSELENALLASHLGRCEECRQFDADIGSVTESLRTAELEQPRLPVPVWRGRRPTVHVLRVGAAAAVLVAAIFAGAFETVLKPQQATIAAPSASAVPMPNAEVSELRALNRSRLEPGLQVSAALIRTLHLPGDS